MKRIILFFMLATTMITAQPRRTDDDNASPGGFGRKFMIEKLELNADQQKQFDKFQSDVQKNQIGLHAKVQALRIDIRDLMREENPNQPKIGSMLTEISKLQNEMKLNHLGFWFNVNKILTPDQQKVWKDHPMKFDGGRREIIRKEIEPMGRRGMR